MGESTRTREEYRRLTPETGPPRVVPGCAGAHAHVTLKTMRRRKQTRKAVRRKKSDVEPPNPKDLSPGDSLGSVPESVKVARRREIITLMNSGAPYDQVITHGRSLGLSEMRVRELMREIRLAWRRDYEEELHTSRAATVRRLRDDLMRMRAQSPKPWSAIRSHENLLAKIEGTMQPVKVQVLDAEETMRDALTQVLGEMNYEDMLQEIARGTERGIVVEGVTVGENELPTAAE